MSEKEILQMIKENYPLPVFVEEWEMWMCYSKLTNLFYTSESKNVCLDNKIDHEMSLLKGS